MAGFEFFLGQLGEAFNVMQNFEVLPGLSLFWLFVVIILLNVLITLFIPMVKRSGVAKSDKSKKGR